MIVISTISFDESSSDVIEWLQDGQVFRLNNDNVPEFYNSGPFSYDLSSDITPVHSIWLRKGGRKNIDVNAQYELVNHATEELYAINGLFYWRSSDEVKVLGTSDMVLLKKPAILLALQKHGLDIPPTLITNQKKDLLVFRKQHDQLIVKPLSDGRNVTIEGKVNKMYTEQLEEDFIDQLGESFYPSLFQKKIKKKYEIRSFYLGGQIFSMAIFSSKENVDVRLSMQYDNVRTIPYKLPQNVEDKMIRFMNSMGLNTGSFDILKGIDDKFYVLEVNPSGEFGALSSSCNYYIEKEIANYLKNGSK